MTIEKVEELRKQELKDELRFPNLEIEETEIEKMFSISWCVYGIINNKFFLSRLLNKLSLKKMGIAISGKGTDEEPYLITTQLGQGKFFNVKYIFNKKKCPFKVGHCFSNAFNMAGEMINLQNVNQADCVSGISLTKANGKHRSILHSVVELNNAWIVDVNLGLVMSTDLYKKLFMFEELTRFDGNRVEKMLEILKKDTSREITKQFNLRTYHLAFAMDDLIDFVENEERRKSHEVFEELEY